MTNITQKVTYYRFHRWLRSLWFSINRSFDIFKRLKSTHARDPRGCPLDSKDRREHPGPSFLTASAGECSVSLFVFDMECRWARCRENNTLTASRVYTEPGSTLALTWRTTIIRIGTETKADLQKKKIRTHGSFEIKRSTNLRFRTMSLQTCN